MYLHLYKHIYVCASIDLWCPTRGHVCQYLDKKMRINDTRTRVYTYMYMYLYMYT